MKNKQFIIQYNPNYSQNKSLANFGQPLIGKNLSQLENVAICRDLSTIYSIANRNRLDLLALLMVKQPDNIYQLAQLLKRPYAHVWADCQTLGSLGIIRLEKNGNDKDKEGIRPICLYKEIVIHLPINEMVNLRNSSILKKDLLFIG